MIHKYLPRLIHRIVGVALAMGVLWGAGCVMGSSTAEQDVVLVAQVAAELDPDAKKDWGGRINEADAVRPA